VASAHPRRGHREDARGGAAHSIQSIGTKPREFSTTITTIVLPLQPSLQDIIELAAVYGSLPAKFTSDSSGKKESWRLSIEETLKAMNAQRLAGCFLTSSIQRYPF